MGPLEDVRFSQTPRRRRRIRHAHRKVSESPNIPSEPEKQISYHPSILAQNKYKHPPPLSLSPSKDEAITNPPPAPIYPTQPIYLSTQPTLPTQPNPSVYLTSAHLLMASHPSSHLPHLNSSHLKSPHLFHLPTYSTYLPTHLPFVPRGTHSSTLGRKFPTTRNSRGALTIRQVMSRSLLPGPLCFP